jgi:hypothetical protein
VAGHKLYTERFHRRGRRGRGGKKIFTTKNANRTKL